MIFSDCSRNGMLVGFADDEPPVLVQLEGKQDTLEFWKQSEALSLLQKQVLAAIHESVAVTSNITEVSLPPREPPRQKSSFFGRKPSRAPDPFPPQAAPNPPVDVSVQLEEVYFRLENEYGLMQTVGARTIILNVEVR
jgi:hypothetical protein